MRDAGPMTVSSRAELRTSPSGVDCLTCCSGWTSHLERLLPFTEGMRTPHPDVTGYGLLLWSLRRPRDRYLSCQLGQCGPDFVLLVRDHTRNDVPFAEICSEMSPLLSLAKVLRVAYVAAGWQTCHKLKSEHATLSFADRLEGPSSSDRANSPVARIAAPIGG